MYKAKVAAAAAVLAVTALAVSACGRDDKKEAKPGATSGAGSPAATVGIGSPAAGAGSPAATAAVSPSPGAGGGAAVPASPAAGGGAATATAELVYKENCISCHGDQLDGRGDAKKNLQKAGAKYTAAQLADIIGKGRNAMPGFKGRLQDAEIKALSEWLAAKK